MDCAACGLPLPPPFELPQPWPWYVKALSVAGILWIGIVAWYALNVELPEAHRMQQREDFRVNEGRTAPDIPSDRR